MEIYRNPHREITGCKVNFRFGEQIVFKIVWFIKITNTHTHKPSCNAVIEKYT